MSIVLRNIENAGDSRHLEASMNEAGDLVVEGHDLGSGVSSVFGPDVKEYEWVYTIKRESLPLLIKALGGDERDDALQVMAEKCKGEEALEIGMVISENDVPHEFWNRMG